MQTGVKNIKGGETCDMSNVDVDQLYEKSVNVPVVSITYVKGIVQYDPINNFPYFFSTSCMTKEDPLRCPSAYKI